MLRRFVPAIGGTLVLFHAWLLGSQLWDGQLAQPGLVLRWATAAALLGALVGLRRSGAPIFWGSKAVSIWLLAALLHGPAMAGEYKGFESPALPEAVTSVIQIAAASVVVGLGLALLAALANSLRTGSRTRLHPVPSRARGAYDRLRVSRVAPRPPPVRSISEQ